MNLPFASDLQVFKGKKDTYLLLRFRNVNGEHRMHCKLSEGIPKEMSEMIAERKRRQEEMDREAALQHEINMRVAAEKERKKGKISGAAAAAISKIESEIRERVEKEVREGLPGDKKKPPVDLEAVDLDGSKKDGAD